MMRNIEFRGLHKSGWVYGYVCTDAHDKNIVAIQEKKSCSSVDSIYQSIIVDSKTVGEFTGLTDKNGVKIFEGDILCAGEAMPASVIFENGCFVFEDDDTRHSKARLHPDKCKRLYVIGNIHENPELLEQ